VIGYYSKTAHLFSTTKRLHAYFEFRACSFSSLRVLETEHFSASHATFFVTIYKNLWLRNKRVKLINVYKGSMAAKLTYFGKINCYPIKHSAELHEM